MEFEIKENPKIKVYDPVGDIDKKFDFYIKIVICILMVAMLSMLLMVGGIILDAFHFNSATYKEYSEKIDTLNSMKEVNIELLDQNKKNQELILEQQSQIINLLNEK